VTTLESYLTGDILRDRADVAAIETVLRETASTIVATFRGTHWPYEVIRGVQPGSDSLSVPVGHDFAEACEQTVRITCAANSSGKVAPAHPQVPAPRK
jgi:hypothetical protein